MVQNFKLIVFSNDHIHPNIQEIEIVKEILLQGTYAFHLRKPGADSNYLNWYLNQFKEEELEKIVLHQHFELRLSFPIKGIHLNTENRNLYSNQLHQHIHPTQLISTSIHELSELEVIPNIFEYYFLSPFFKSVSKQNYYPSRNLLLDMARDNNLTTGKKIVALGGITADNIQTVMTLPLLGAAVLGSVWNSNQPITEFSFLKKKVESYTHPV